MKEVRYVEVEKNKRKGISFSKLIVSFVIGLVLIFTGLVLYIFYKTGSEPMTMIGAFMAFMTVEVWQLARIKRTSIEQEKYEDNLEVTMEDDY